MWAEVRVWVEDKQDQSLGRVMTPLISFPPSTQKPQKQQDRRLYKSSQGPCHRKLSLRMRNTAKPHLLHLLVRVSCNKATKSVPAVHMAGSSGF